MIKIKCINNFQSTIRLFQRQGCSSLFHTSSVHTEDFELKQLGPFLNKKGKGTEKWRKHHRLPHHIDNVKWREEQGLPHFLNTVGPIADKADYSYLDGRPVPYSVGQKKRLLEQKEHLENIFQLCKEVDHGKEQYQQKLKAKEEAKKNIINSKLKPKGNKEL